MSRTSTTDYDTGGKYQKAAQAVTAAMQGLAGGDLAQAASGAVSPYVAEIIHSQTTDSATGKVNVEANAMAHAVWGAIAAASGNNSALAGAAGAVSGELLGRWIAAEYYPDVMTEELSEEQKSTISALSTLAAGLMGGLSGGSSADAVAGAQAGKNAVENNFLGPESREKLDKAVENQQNGKDLLAASKEIVRQNNIDRHSDELLGKFQTDPQSMTESECQQLAAYLNVYGYELQNSYGLSPEKAQQLVNSLLSGEPALKPSPGYPAAAEIPVVIMKHWVI